MRSAIVQLFETARDFVDRQPFSEDPAERARVMLVSRRLACIYMMIVDAGYEPLDANGRAEVVFDRVLEANPDWQAVPVLVLDDVVIFGSTMARRMREMAGFEDVLARVAAIDLERSDPTYLAAVWGRPEGDPAAYGCTLEEARAFADDVARCLYQSQTPFFTDFPMTSKLDVDAGLPHRLVSLCDWYAADVTLSIGIEDQLAYSFLPKEEHVSRILRRLHPSAAALAGLLKVRVFFGPSRMGRRSMRVIPIGVPQPTLAQSIERIVDEVRESVGAGLDARRWSAPAQHRLIQMYLSAAVLAEFFQHLRCAMGDEAPDLDGSLLDSSHIRAYFESHRETMVRKAFEAIVAAPLRKRRRQTSDNVLVLSPRSKPYESLDLRREMAIAGIAGWAGRSLRHYAMPKRPEVGELAPVNELWAQRLLHYWSTIINPHQEQIQARLRELGPSAGQARSDAERAYDWLRCGVTAAELERSFFHWAKPADAWERGLLSLALDMGNDLGIAVPSTHDESRFAFGRSAIYRQYRAGENATAASSSVVDLANVDNPEAVLAKMDWMTRSALGIDRDENWQDLDPHRQNLVREIAEENAIVLEGTTDGAPLVSVRAGVIEEVDEDGLLVRLSGISYDGPDEYEFIDEGALVEVDRSKATKGSAVTWCVLGPKPGKPSGYRHAIQMIT